MIKGLKERNLYYMEKLSQIKEYMDNPEEELPFNLKNFIRNINNTYRSGRLIISEDLITEFKNIGVILPRQKRVRRSDEQKYKAIIDFIENNPNINIIDKSVNERGDLIGWYKIYFQKKYNDGLRNEILEDLLKRGIIKDLSAYKMQQIYDSAKKYNISNELAYRIYNKYGDIEEFIKKYKKREIILSEDEKRYVEIKNPNFVVLSSKPITIKEKQGYGKLIRKIIKKSNLNSEIAFLNIDTINFFLDNYGKDGNFEKYCEYLEYIYGINGKEKKTYDELAKENKKSKALIQQNVDRIIDKLIKYNENNKFIFYAGIGSADIKKLKILRNDYIIDNREKIKAIILENLSRQLEATESELEQLVNFKIETAPISTYMENPNIKKEFENIGVRAWNILYNSNVNLHDLTTEKKYIIITNLKSCRNKNSRRIV